MNNKINIGINGFGRIGRIASRIILQRKNMRLSAINSMADVNSHAYLFKYDSTYGTLMPEVRTSGNNLFVGNNKISISNRENPMEIPWNEYHVDIVLDATGKFRTSDDLRGHLSKQVKYVVLSSPAKDNTKTIVMGVNEEEFDPRTDRIISNSSCTTNCLAVTLKVIDDNFNVRRGYMTTVT
jgi:glyceraldehyde 3-phosphate dehydrogenase